MISKEEIRKHYIFSTEHELDENNKMLKEYINQLETEKEKIIKKLEERIKELKDKSGGNTFHVQSMINAEIREIENILKIMKGGNDE